MHGDSSLIAFVPVTSLERGEDFYVDQLGLQLTSSGPDFLVLNSNGAMLRLTLVQTPPEAEYTIVGWQVEDIESEATALMNRGLHINQYEGFDQDSIGIWTAPSGDKVVWFDDPDGNTLSLTEFANNPSEPGMGS
jgi:catechol 2,3-dioxygenase-like lactoylglutathione lyase family enzyme